MYITMAGIDHNKATIEYRELFAFTKAGSIEGMKQLKKEYPIQGCIILSTCNRTELWISYDQESVLANSFGEKLSTFKMLCRLKGLDPDSYKEFALERQDEEAISHLMKLACGLESKIFGEDQIISQVREALIIARRNQCTDIVLEKVFQTAIRAAKQVKSQVPLVIADNSAALQAVALLRKKLSSLQDVPCMVIGNGQIGKLTATELLKHGAKVKMTLRKKIHGNEVKSSIIPPGCTMIPYENRVQELPTVEVVISATRSPHFTLKRDEVEGFLDNSMKPMIFIDLAVPRDIDPEISQCNQALVFDMDHLGIESYQESNRQSIGASIKILEEHLSELKQWFSFREMVSPIHEIIRAFEEDVSGRITNPVKHMQLKEEDKEQLMKAMEKVVGKSMGKILFGLKDTLREPLWQECLEAIHKSAMKDTIKY